MRLLEARHFDHGRIPFTIYQKNIVVFPLMLIYDSIIIYTYIKVKSFRKKPGDLFVMIAVNDIIQGIMLILYSLNSQWSFLPLNIPVTDSSVFCQLYFLI